MDSVAINIAPAVRLRKHSSARSRPSLFTAPLVTLAVATTLASLLLATAAAATAAAATNTHHVVTSTLAEGVATGATVTGGAPWTGSDVTATIQQLPCDPAYGGCSNLSSLAYLEPNVTSASLWPDDVLVPVDIDAPGTHTTTISTSTIVVSIVLLAVIVGTVIGNILVCVAVCLVRKLRRPCNYLLVSLAVSDLCVALLVMPPALLYEVLEEWRFGEVFCDIWVSFDVLSCTASILNLCAISVDRYWAITKPLEYGVKRTPRRMIGCIALVWLAAACISLPPLLILGNEHRVNGQPACSVCQNFFYQIYATVGAFYIPLAVMLFVYCQIFRAARRIVMEEKRAQKRLESAINGATVTNVQEKKLLPMTTTTNATVNHGSGPIDGPLTGKLLTANATKATAPSSPQHKRLRFQLAKERKASTTLGIIMSAFTICWLPFFILALVRPFMKDDHRTLSSFFLWLGYANSLLNPIIYATLNRDFRKPFQEILYFRCSSLNHMMREDFYHSQYGDPGSQRLVITHDAAARESFL
ncbi:5-hydroxytryptamine receptor 1-like [Anopheles albimanus]|uniref:G-protein coupled receptors family 1 profile domain-containing protein n=1 Tax=Anopheles albimanus TaxID=7167 RepID=A0A8W7K828_ANOAL|nr:5-hydroxytryptamine receptor 1-like [Anopheles albimanus]XP_035773029.1 5-hydroxytryptamine receptor 1-like [Anopheles albimanus]XP_035773030.1 5-hydroxytryptamine receptor 1-like [Anopheles albimanus]XP_035773031.1 5-hydroxytryptamine receptor 1-like [Anopheles albimanus]XP_035773033.1 5-hydroxytryptamine receptor 1-like [Anopheles albimanus]XP_035773034.1 5-hydroxytryptamine receptor 1-like [Anopheles albimanus]XP_035773035.1 5-hydroxytryptamine receptor 1-like [Anopheles albimanus]XP_0